MKHVLIFLLVIMFFGYTKNVKAQQAEQKVLVTLQSNEDIVYNESCIPMSFTQGNLYLVTKTGDQIFTYDNSGKQGPFKDFKSANIKACKLEEKPENICSVIKKEEQAQSQYIQNNEDGSIKIVYKGKSYTDFAQILQVATSSDGSKIAVTGLNAKFEPLFLSPEGKMISLKGETQQLVISPLGNIAIAAMKGDKNLKIPTEKEVDSLSKQLEQDLQSIDFSKMTPEEIQAFSEKMEGKYGTSDTASKNPDSYLYLNDGRKLGPYKFGGYTSENPAFCKTGGENWYFIAQNKLYINGTMVKDFGETSVTTCDVWISPDGKRYAAYMNYEKVLFSDGQSYPFPFQIKTETEKGKVYLIWIGLDSKKQLILYKKAL